MIPFLLIVLFFSVTINATDPEASIWKSDMTDEMQKFAVKSAIKAMTNSKYFTEMAISVRHDFDAKYGKYWQTIVSEGAGFDLWYEKDNLIYFAIDGVNFLVFKALQA